MFRDKQRLLNGEIFYTLKEAQILIEQWRILYNTIRPRSSLHYQTPAPEAVQVSHVLAAKGAGQNLRIH